MPRKSNSGKTSAKAGKQIQNKKTSSPAKSSTSKSKSSKDNRDGNRIPIQLLVDYKSDGHYLFDFCRDLGTGGVFIETNKPMPQGSEIDLTFTIPDSKKTLTTKGQVIWVQEPLTHKVSDKNGSPTPGMGVQFKGFSENQRALLEEFVSRYHGNKFLGEKTKVPKSA